MPRSSISWDHNMHYHPLILDRLPSACRSALDVGCGTGALTRELRQSVPKVAGIDSDRMSIEVASSHPCAGDVRYVFSDFFTFPFEPESFDLVSMVASLHHMDARKALARMASLLRPGGLLAVVGLARNSTALDYALDPLAFVDDRFHRGVQVFQAHMISVEGTPAAVCDAPRVWPPPHTYREMRQIAGSALPGVRYRRHLLWRYSLLWVKPA